MCMLYGTDLTKSFLVAKTFPIFIALPSVNTIKAKKESCHIIWVRWPVAMQSKGNFGRDASFVNVAEIIGVSW